MVDQTILDISNAVHDLADLIENVDTSCTDAEIQTWSGRSQQEKNKDMISAKDYGAIGDGIYHPLSEKFTSVADAQAAYPLTASRITSLTQSIDFAAIQEAVMLGSAVYIPHGRYVLTDTIELQGNVIYGDGVDDWQHMDSSPQFKSDANGTHLYFYGTGTKNYTSEYNNAELTTGGVVSNPSAYSTGDANYSLYDFTNADATSIAPATPKLLSCGIYIGPGKEGSAIRDLRILPYFNGLVGYTTNNHLNMGDDWDIGIFQDSCSNVQITNVQCVGYWRITAHLISCSTSYDKLRAAYNLASTITPAGRAFNTYISDVIYQGQTGLMIRGGVIYKALACTSDTVTIEWDNSHPFPPSGKDMLFFSPKGTFKYTNWSKVGNTLVFSGVTPDPNAAGLVNNPIRYGGHYGIGGSTVHNSVITGLEHTSLCLSSDTSTLNQGVSKCFEAHGSSIRNVHFYSTYFQTRQDCFFQVHNFSDLWFYACQFEGAAFKSSLGGNYVSPAGVRAIASPEPSNNTRVSNAQGYSAMFFKSGTNITGAYDFNPMVTSIGRFLDSGLFEPRYVQNDQIEYNSINSSDYLTRTALKGKGIKDYSATDWWVCTGGRSTYSLSVTQSGNVNIGGQLSFDNSAFINVPASKSIYLRSNNTVMVEISSNGECLPSSSSSISTPSLGSPSRPWLRGFINKIILDQTKNVFILSGAGSPEGNVLAGVGSTYHRTDGGSGACFYIKESGTGSLGWVAK